MELRTQDYLGDWEKTKPVEGHMRPDDALQRLQIFESKYTRLKEERDKVTKAKEALELQETGPISTNEERMQVAFEEMQDLKGVWYELRKIWEQIDEMKEKPWLSVQPRKLRQQIDNLLAQMKELPSRLRHRVPRHASPLADRATAALAALAAVGRAGTFPVLLSHTVPLPKQQLCLV